MEPGAQPLKSLVPAHGFLSLKATELVTADRLRI